MRPRALNGEERCLSYFFRVFCQQLNVEENDPSLGIIAGCVPLLRTTEPSSHRTSEPNVTHRSAF